MRQPFYLVWNPDTGYTMFRHESKQSAVNEARRLALLHRGSDFIVLAPVTSTKSIDVQVDDFDYSDNDELPF